MVYERNCFFEWMGARSWMICAYDTPDSISSCMLVNIIVLITDLTFIFTRLFSHVISCSFKVFRYI